MSLQVEYPIIEVQQVTRVNDPDCQIRYEYKTLHDSKQEYEEALIRFSEIWKFKLDNYAIQFPQFKKIHAYCVSRKEIHVYGISKGVIANE